MQGAFIAKNVGLVYQVHWNYEEQKKKKTHPTQFLSFYYLTVTFYRV